MKTNQTLVSFYKNNKATDKMDITLDSYFNMVQSGEYQDFVITSRLLKQQGKTDQYKASKDSAPCITGSAIMNHGSKTASNVLKLNGLICIDIDENLPENIAKALEHDKHTYIMHRSFGGDGFVIFVKINPDRFLDSFNGLAQYYFDNYQVTIDHACKNINRLRYISFDPEAHMNENSLKFAPKDVKRFKEPKKVDFIFTQDDFTNILHQITDRNIDLCNEEYFKYVRIGLAIASKFGLGGLEHFHYICQFGQKYNKERTTRDYNGFCKNPDGSTKIGTFYYYCKESGIEIYSPKTKQIINSVKVLKSQGTPTIDTVSSHILSTHEIEATEADKTLIQALIDSKIDYSDEANKDKSETEQLIDYIVEKYTPWRDLLTDNLYIHKHTLVNDEVLNDIYLDVNMNLSFQTTLNQVFAVLNSGKSKKINILADFLRDNASNPEGVIDSYVDCINPNSTNEKQKQYNRWAFKRWLVGGLHNWTATEDEKIVCPLTLVLCGQSHGKGKTSFLRGILPKELDVYFTQDKINAKDKDSTFKLCTSLVAFDDEFGGNTFKDVKEFKAISDINIVTQRRPYGRSINRYKRRAILCGSTNEMDILNDPTGNRRILPIRFDECDYEKMVSIDKTAMIIEAYNLLQDGFKWIIRTEEDMDYLKENSQENEQLDPFEDIFLEHFSFTEQGKYFHEVILNQGRILNFINMKSITKMSIYDLKKIVTRNKKDMPYDLFRIGNFVSKGYRLFMKENIVEVGTFSLKEEKMPF